MQIQDMLNHAASIHVQGDRNILLNNIADGDVIIEGNGNMISGLVFTKPEARLVLRGDNPQVLGVPQERICLLPEDNGRLF